MVDHRHPNASDFDLEVQPGICDGVRRVICWVIRFAAAVPEVLSFEGELFLTAP